MNVRDGMSNVVLAIGPTHTLREAARMMSARRVGAAVVIDPDHAGVGILTERDVLDSIGSGQDPDAELAAHHCTSDLVFAAPAWTLEKAAAAMVRGGFRHLVVIDGHEVTGLLSMRDIVRCWSGSPVPAPGQAAAGGQCHQGMAALVHDRHHRPRQRPGPGGNHHGEREHATAQDQPPRRQRLGSERVLPQAAGMLPQPAENAGQADRRPGHVARKRRVRTCPWHPPCPEFAAAGGPAPDAAQPE